MRTVPINEMKSPPPFWGGGLPSLPQRLPHLVLACLGLGLGRLSPGVFVLVLARVWCFPRGDPRPGRGGGCVPPPTAGRTPVPVIAPRLLTALLTGPGPPRPVGTSLYSRRSYWLLAPSGLLVLAGPCGAQGICLASSYQLPLLPPKELSRSTTVRREVLSNELEIFTCGCSWSRHLS